MGKNFLGNDFLLNTNTAVKLYHEYAKDMPIFDYHCHLQPQEIYENRRFENITQLWLEADHYKWRLMRANGVEEKYITGSGTDWEKFQKWAQTLEKAIGNPLYHWSHMELKKYFGYEGVLHSGSAKEIWDFCSEKIKAEDFTARALIQKSNVKELCTTDDPADSLVWHKKIKEDKSFGVIVLPAWRPEKAMKINHISYIEYIEKLSKTCDIQITSYQELIWALTARMDYFEEYGCKISDHSLDYVMYCPADKEKIEEIFKRRLEGRKLSKEDIKIFETAFMLDMAKEYHRRNWVMQLHYGVQRNVNKKIFDRLGEDAGVDCISNDTPSNQLAGFFDALAGTDMLPKTILYSLNSADNAVIESIMGCFQDDSCIGKIQHGSAWWFHDNKHEIKEQMTSLASLGLLGNFIGMLTDSRSFSSYVRHDYFRRILCDMIGTWVENGEFPKDWKLLKKIVENICYYNIKNYCFG